MFLSYLLSIVCLSACLFICLSFCDALSLLPCWFICLSLSRGGGGGESVTAISSVKAQMCLHLDVQF